MEYTTTTLALHTGAIIRRERLRRDISQELLAEKIGKTAQYISLLENGDRCGSVATYLSIANAFGIHVSKLLEDIAEEDRPVDERGVLQLFANSAPLARKVMTATLIAVYDAFQSER